MLESGISLAGSLLLCCGLSNCSHNYENHKPAQYTCHILRMIPLSSKNFQCHLSISILLIQIWFWHNLISAPSLHRWLNHPMPVHMCTNAYKRTRRVLRWRNISMRWMRRMRIITPFDGATFVPSARGIASSMTLSFWRSTLTVRVSWRQYKTKQYNTDQYKRIYWLNWRSQKISRLDFGRPWRSHLIHQGVRLGRGTEGNHGSGWYHLRCCHGGLHSTRKANTEVGGTHP